MVELYKEITATLRSVCPESYQGYNYKPTVTYPYLTFDLDTTPSARNQDTVYMDVDIFDHSTSNLGVIELEDALKNALCYRRTLTDMINLIYRFAGSSQIDTGQEQLKHRNVRFEIKTDWRTKIYGIA